MTKWFVMLRCGMEAEFPTPMVVGGETDSDWDDSVALFDSRRAAEDSASENGIGSARGFEVYEWETGL